ncbi:bestrophin family ion channel [Paraflavitalea sp. CAU 1676]|uniref:bestrophin family protein n=1 Tax=Paraflavitalea sp. CAU 1676 TaxID=3032598 RepID=UPI0023DA570F|nr:bestrophin family ion channel [Paraflavitalea sp. CAU 1676]MDF2191878.1 bestrophin family ion channel [Paraflavitalea sp. CAU 1676]
MHTGKRYPLREFIVWSRRDIYLCFFLTLVPTILFCFGFTFIAISWLPVAMLGTAVAFIVGFKNNASYNRLWEARQIYGAIINDSRSFAVKARDFLGGKSSVHSRLLFDRHFAWLTFLRYQLREPRKWETMDELRYEEYMSKAYKIPEREEPLESAVQSFLSPDELAYLLSKKNRASQSLALQSETINELHRDGFLNDLQQMQLQKSIDSFYEQQGKAERIKNFPYPRNFSSITTYLLYLFVILLPFGLLKEFNHLGDGTFLAGYTIYFLIPFATVVGWAFVTLDAVGDSSINPFEGSPNDVPITQISKMIETDLKEMLDDPNLPAAVAPINNILL